MAPLFRQLAPYDLEGLRREVHRARRLQDFSEGAYGHCISLPGPTDLPGEYGSHHNNLPFAGALESCPVMRAIFDGLRTEKASYRLLRRAPKTAYGLHDDRDKGAGILRFQIPIDTNPDAYICVMKDGVEEAGLARVVDEIREGQDFRFDMERFQRTVGPWLDVYSLAPGHLYHFDTNRVHTAINAGSEERIVLGIDLVANDWVVDWMRDEVNDPVPATPQEACSNATWEWNSLGHGLITHAAHEGRESRTP